MVAFEAEGRRLVLVSTDLIGFYGDTADAVRGAILKVHGREPSALLLAAIHTHAGPTVTLDRTSGHPDNVAYTERLTGRLVRAVGDALSSRQPAQVGFGTGSSPAGVNRREIQDDEAGRPRVRLGRTGVSFRGRAGLGGGHGERGPPGGSLERGEGLKPLAPGGGTGVTSG